MKFHRDQQYEYNDAAWLAQWSAKAYTLYIETNNLDYLAWNQALWAMYQLVRSNLVDSERFQCYSRFRRYCNNTLEHIRELKIEAFIKSIPLINRMNF